MAGDVRVTSQLTPQGADDVSRVSFQIKKLMTTARIEPAVTFKNTIPVQEGQAGAGESIRAILDVSSVVRVGGGRRQGFLRKIGPLMVPKPYRKPNDYFRLEEQLEEVLEKFTTQLMSR